jgi:NADH:ubiquinone oxidoreductase subunit 6 (subunit J)
VVVLSTCGLFLLQAAPFLMASTVIVYAGAIIVTFLFVLMLAQRRGPSDADDRSREPLLATIAGFVLLGALLAVIQLNYEMPDLEHILERHLPRAREAAAKTTAEEMEAALGDDYFRRFFSDLNDYEEDLGEGKVPPELKAYKELLDTEGGDISDKWARGKKRGGAEGLAQMRDALLRLDEETNRLHALLGSQPPDANVPLSPLSGPPPNSADLEWDVHGNARLPAANTAALGQSLFTDFLLAVELAGTLLLVATIGAIAIAQRGGERHA